MGKRYFAAVGEGESAEAELDAAHFFHMPIYASHVSI